jgi:hypothetical protein
MVLCDGTLREFKRNLKKKFADFPHEMTEAVIILSAQRVTFSNRLIQLLPSVEIRMTT